jgi:hypothetical protein
MVHLAMWVALLSFVGLRGLIAIPSLLHLLPLGTHISIVTKLTTLEASGVCRVWRCSGSHWCTHSSSLLILLESGVRCLRSGLLKLLPRLLELLSRTWGLLLPNVPTWSSIAETCALLWAEVRTSDTPRMSIAGGFPLLLSQLSTIVLQTDGTVYQVLQCGESVRHQLILKWST